MPSLGHAALVLSFLLSLGVGGASFYGARWRNETAIRFARGGVFALFSLVTLSSLALFYALLTDDFSVRYVAATSERNLPTLYKIGAFWAAQEGSLLLWLWILTGYMLALALSGKGQELFPWAQGVLSLVAVFFSFLTSFVANPFSRIYPPPADGNGLNPLLQDPGMWGHPLLLYLGYVGMSVPYAFGMAALITRSPGAEWLRFTRRWTIFAWTFLTLGIVVGGWWAYRELGWGGYWAWDPVENASFMPWLTATAFFHSAMVEERRGILKNWNMLLIIFSFALTIFGTFITRSGILSSVHAFAQSDIAPWFMGFIGLILALSFYLVLDRYGMLVGKGDLESFLSKEASFLANNLILATITAVVFVGEVIPLLTKLWGVEVSIGPPYFNAVTGPFFLLMVLLMAVCPLLAWRRTQLAGLPRFLAGPFLFALAFALLLAVGGVRRPGALLGFFAVAFVVGTIAREFWQASRVRAQALGISLPRAWGGLVLKNQRRYGGYIVHLGIALIAFGVVGSSYYQLSHKFSLRLGESATVGPYTLTYLGLEEGIRDNVDAVWANVELRRGDKVVGMIRPERRFYPKFEQMGPSTEAAIRSSPAGDIYLILGGWDAGGTTASFQAFWNPLVPWIWVGLWVVVAGAVLALWPLRRARETEEEALYLRLRELEYDYRMGKIGVSDYETLRAEILAEISARAEARPRRRGRRRSP